LKRVEPWILAAWGLLATELGLLVYYASAGPGAGPVRVFRAAPMVLMGAALLVGLTGVAWSFLRPPFVRARRVAALVCCGFVFLSAGYPLPFPAHRRERPSRVPFQLPVEGEWIAAWGGDDTSTNLLARSSPDLRYVLVLVPAEERQGAGPVVTAPAPGRIVSFGASEEGDQGRSATLVIEVAPDEYLFLTGLDPDERPPRPGGEVGTGEPVGRIAPSSSSPFTPGPHLGMHLQDTPDPHLGQGIPWFLHGVEIDGRTVQRGMPRGGGRRNGAWTGQHVRRAIPAAGGSG